MARPNAESLTRMPRGFTQDCLRPKQKAWAAPHLRRLEPSEALLRKIERNDPAFARAARELIERDRARGVATGSNARTGRR